jgi:hypothetical protein
MIFNARRILTSLGRPARALTLLLLALIGAAPSESNEPVSLAPASTQSVRFATVDIRIDSKNHPLAAYQLEVSADSPHVKLAGIEGGEHAAFREPPYYDPAALNQNRIILAAFNTGSDLPAKEFRAARLHVQISGDVKPKWEVKLTVASASDGSAIPGATAAASMSAAPTEGAAP